MGVYVVTGVDLHRADVIADLSTEEGRKSAVEKIWQSAGTRLDGAVLAAGLGPIPGREEIIAKVNFLGVVELLAASTTRSKERSFKMRAPQRASRCFAST